MIFKNIITLFLILFVSFLSFSQSEGIVTIESSAAIKTVVQNKINYNRSNPKINGFRIQLFNGSENGARNMRYKYLGLFPNEPTSVDWDSPEWKVRVGKYKTRLAADKALERIKLAFSYAIIVEMKIRA